MLYIQIVVTAKICSAGYELTEQICTDLNECTKNIHQCHERAVCVNSVGNYSCECVKNYTGNGINCIQLHPVWSAGQYTECSTTCGFGVMQR